MASASHHGGGIMAQQLGESSSSAKAESCMAASASAHRAALAGISVAAGNSNGIINGGMAAALYGMK